MFDRGGVMFDRGGEMFDCRGVMFDRGGAMFHQMGGIFDRGSALSQQNGENIYRSIPVLGFDQTVFHADNRVALSRETLVMGNNYQCLFKFIAKCKKKFVKVFTVFGIQVS